VELGQFAQYLRLPVRVYGAASLVAAALVFLPERVLSQLGLASFVTDHRASISLVLLASIALLVAELIRYVWQEVETRRRREAARRDEVAAREAARRDETAEREAREQREQQRRDELEARRRKRLSKLTSDEKRLLLPFIAADRRSRRVPMNSATVHALKGSDVLGMATQVTTYDFKLNDYAAEVFIQPWALEYLKEHPELLAVEG
jgi:hypothetical protein